MVRKAYYLWYDPWYGGGTRKANFRVEEEVLRAIEERAKAEGVPVSELMRRAIRTYLGLPPQPPSADLQGLVSKVSELAEVVDKLASGLHQLAERVAEIERRLPAQQAGSVEEAPSAGGKASPGSAKPRRTAMDILREQRFILEPEASHLKNRDAFFGKLRAEGAVVVETAKGRVAVLPEVWEDLRSRLSSVGTSREDAVRERLGGELFRLFRFLSESGELYYDGRVKQWRFVEEAGRSS